MYASNAPSRSEVIDLVCKKPRYDEARKVFVMKFGNRVKRSSVKNFILVRREEEEKVLSWSIQNVLLFGKCTK